MMCIVQVLLLLYHMSGMYTSGIEGFGVDIRTVVARATSMCSVGGRFVRESLSLNYHHKHEVPVLRPHSRLPNSNNVDRGSLRRV